MFMDELIRQEKPEKEKEKNIREELILFEENPVLMQASGVMFLGENVLVHLSTQK